MVLTYKFSLIFLYMTIYNMTKYLYCSQDKIVGIMLILNEDHTHTHLIIKSVFF